MGLTLAWTNNSPNASGFKVERKDGATGLYIEIATLPKTPTGIFTTAYADVGVQPGVTYTYQVRGYSDAGGFTAYSDPVSGTQLASITPRSLAVYDYGTSLKLGWTNNATGQSGYKVERKTGASGTYAEIAKTASSASYTDATPDLGVVYYYRVRAYTVAGGNTDFSNEAPGIVPLTATALKEPVGAGGAWSSSSASGGYSSPSTNPPSSGGNVWLPSAPLGGGGGCTNSVCN